MIQLQNDSEEHRIAFEDVFEVLSQYLGRYVRFEGLQLGKDMDRSAQRDRQRAAELIGVYDKETPDKDFIAFELRTGFEGRAVLINKRAFERPSFRISVLTDGKWRLIHSNSERTVEDHAAKAPELTSSAPESKEQVEDRILQEERERIALANESYRETYDQVIKVLRFARYTDMAKVLESCYSRAVELNIPAELDRKSSVYRDTVETLSRIVTRKPELEISLLLERFENLGR